MFSAPSSLSRPRNARFASSRRGFTLGQVLVVLVILSVLSALLLGLLRSGESAARRAECDVRLKTISIALGAFRQENGKYPAELQELTARNYLQSGEIMRCPRDPRPGGTYADYYVVRGPRDTNLPILVCPFHEESHQGNQAFTGRYTTQFATSPARLVGAANATVQRPGKEPVAATTGMELHGGDIVRVGDPTATASSGGLLGNLVAMIGDELDNRPTLSGNGSVTIVFADGSKAILEEGAEVTVLQSFINGHSSAPLYTLVRQTMGRALYKVHRGSKFDVVTPTATAGARGTEFYVTIHQDGSTSLWVEEGQVAFSSLLETILAPLQRGTLLDKLTGLIFRP